MDSAMNNAQHALSVPSANWTVPTWNLQLGGSLV